MPSPFLLLSFIPALILFSAASAAPETVSTRETFDYGWKFARFGLMPDGTTKTEPGGVREVIIPSTEEKEHTADKAIDGNSDTRWSASSGSANQTLVLDMGRPVEPYLIKLEWEKKAQYLFKIEGSPDGTEWTIIAEKKEKQSVSEGFDIVSPSGSHRYFKLTVTELEKGNWASVREWEFLNSLGVPIKPLPPEKDTGASPSEPDFDDSGWRPQDLPHDWGIEGPFDMQLPNDTAKLPWPGIGWYRKTFTIPATSKGNRFYLDFDGVMSRPKIYVNGNLAGEWKYGYTSFRVDITPYLKWGEENLVAVRADNPMTSSRWYPGSGIYRHVWLCETKKVHLGQWGVFVRTPMVNSEYATVATETTVENHSETSVAPVIMEEILDPSQKVVATKNTYGAEIGAGEKGKLTSTLFLEKPLLWDLDTPHLYTLRTTVKTGDEIVDIRESRFGVRTIEWKPDKGFFLNGRHVTLNGVCQHSDLGPLGTAVYKRGYERQIRILKEMGTNAIRTSHNPPAPEFLEACDEMGMLVIDELFDMWKYVKKTHDYHNYFMEWHERDLVNFCHRDRNHPCVILWSTGNEVREQGDPGSFWISQRLTDLFHREDPSRLVTAGCSYAVAAFNGFADTIDVYGYNYKPHAYREFSEKRPHQPVYGSETSSCVSTRGEYFFPSKEDFWNQSKGYFNFQVSSYDLYAPGWAFRPDVEFKGLDENKRVAGEFVWTGFDYLGEPTPYNHDSTNALNFSNSAEAAEFMEQFKKLGSKAPSRSSYFGIVDLAGFKKDRFYLYQARWRPDLKMAHILPHWNWNDDSHPDSDRRGKITPVHVYTTGDTAELFLNGQSQGIRKKGNTEHNAYRLVWEDVVYEPGTLEVRVTKEGKHWVQQEISTTGPAHHMTVETDRSELIGDGRDLAYLTIAVKDEQGKTVPRASQQLYIEVTGPAEVIGVCNGDPTDFNNEPGTEEKGPFMSPQVKAFHGLAQVIIRSQRNGKGEAVIKVKSPNLPPVELKISIRKVNDTIRN